MNNSQTINNFLTEINENNSTNYKLEVLKKYKDSDLVKRILKMTHDNIEYNYGVGKTTLQKMDLSKNTNELDITDALDFLENKLSTRELTGNAAISALNEILNKLSKDDSDVIRKILERDLRINVGRTQINKIHKDLIIRPAYLRCDVLTKKTAKNISYPAILEKKADGMAVFASIKEDKVLCYTRSGEEFILESLQHLRFNESLINNTIQGEFTIKNESDRSQSNGLINSLIKFVNNNNKTLTQQEAKEIEDSIIFELWDILSDEEISNAKNKIKNNVTYKQRFTKLTNIFNM